MRHISVITVLMLGFIFLIALYDLQQESMRSITLVEDPSSVSVDFSKLPIAKKKQYFIEKTLPAIINVKKHLDEQYSYILSLSQRESLTRKEMGRIDYLKKRYRAEDMQELLVKLHTHPISIVLAQAALETGWGTSRFYNKANNIFGIWSFNKKEPRIAAGETRGTKTIYVKKYSSLEESIEGYFKMMASARAYSKFREARFKEKNPFKLIRHLTHYSELRHEYVRRLYNVIKRNRFYTYDTPSFEPIALSHILPEKKNEATIPPPAVETDGNTSIKPDITVRLNSGADLNTSHDHNNTAEAGSTEQKLKV